MGSTFTLISKWPKLYLIKTVTHTAKLWGEFIRRQTIELNTLVAKADRLSLFSSILSAATRLGKIKENYHTISLKNKNHLMHK